MRHLISIAFMLMVPLLRAQLVGMQFSVKDPKGNPIGSATITLETAEKRILPFAAKKFKTLKCRTDENGVASERFFCWDGHVIATVVAPGYYSRTLRDLSFKTDFDTRTKETVFLEKEKTVNVCLREKVNPVPLYSYRGSNKVWSFGRKESVAGYDLKVGDWVCPRGRGEVADFYIRHEMIPTNETYRCVASLAFAPGGGAYVSRATCRESAPLVYVAETNKLFKTEFCSVQTWDASGRTVLSGDKLLLDNEALVIRSRAKVDESGSVIEAHYSKIYGPFSIAGVFEYRQSFFNPRINDCNLELDVGKNLSAERSGEFFP